LVTAAPTAWGVLPFFEWNEDHVNQAARATTRSKPVNSNKRLAIQQKSIDVNQKRRQGQIIQVVILRCDFKNWSELVRISQN
jgi:hypothetical protein